MRTSLWRCWRLDIGLLATLVLLAGCAASGGLTCATPTANASPGTASTTTITTAYMHGSVSLLTDYSIYAPGESMTVTFANHLPVTLATPVPIGCPLFGLERQMGATWQDVPDCLPTPPPSHSDLGPRNEPIIYVEAGKTVIDRITDDVVPPGTYRVVAGFGEPYASGGDGVLVYSSPVRFCTCGQCA